ncbi:MAG: glucose-6-phosphate dehydrogenase [Bacillota bacterium]
MLVIFGGTGDLTHKKLIPALYNLKYQGWLSPSFAVVAVGRRDKTVEVYRDEAYNSVKNYSRFKINERLWKELSSRIYYKKVDFTNSENYMELKLFLDEIDGKFGTQGNRIFYLAVAPMHFENITRNLKAAGMAQNTGHSWQRIVIEKPYGTSLESARILNREVAETFGEENTYRIDHYLGKEMVRSIMGLRFFNSVFEPVWNNKFIDCIQISACENIGIENRGEYYDKAGALVDMVQNHVLQMLALLAMEPPAAFDAESVRDEKVKVLKSIRDFTTEASAGDIVLGQYSEGILEGNRVPGYRQESKVSPDSVTETFVALKIQVDTPRWEGVPFYIRTGKRLAAKKTEIVIQFRHPSGIAGLDASGGLAPNLLVIRVEPKEEIFMQFNIKTPGISDEVDTERMDYFRKCKICEAELYSPEAYEKLFVDIINGDSTLFARWDEVERSWEVVEMINALKKCKEYSFPNYEPGSWGPAEAGQLLQKDGRHWWDLQG